MNLNTETFIVISLVIRLRSMANVSKFILHLLDTVFLCSLLKTNAAVHRKVSVNLLAAETFQPNRNQNHCAHKWVKFVTH